MDYSLKTSWMLIQGASEGEQQAREEFARRYAPVTRAYLTSRWRRSPLKREIEDAIQEVFLECFKEGGVLGRADGEREGGFRAFFFGMVRNVALKFEERGNRPSRATFPSTFDMNEIEADEDESCAEVFDRAWARSLLKDAAARMAAKARSMDDAAVKRVELLRLRFQEALPIREIAQSWKVNPTFVHRQYARARKEFEASLMEVLAQEHPDTQERVNQLLDDLMNTIA
jgi:RNA polymerase sigma-70 factor (ECF subfamily)